MENSNIDAFEILLIDDDKIINLLHKKNLRKIYLEQPIITCENGKEALDYIKDEHNANKKFLILIDLNMPKMNGWEFLAALEETEVVSRTKVVVLTSSTRRKDREIAELYASVELYLTKPLIDVSPIQETVRDLKGEIQVLR